jgi:hypothetical protein
MCFSFGLLSAGLSVMVAGGAVGGVLEEAVANDDPSCDFVNTG